jgi:hypothetical protein
LIGDLVADTHATSIPIPGTQHTEKASALSAAVNWVFRDGVGMTCSLVFSSLAATSFDGNIKEWRLFADVINDAGLTLGASARAL